MLERQAYVKPFFEKTAEICFFEERAIFLPISQAESEQE
jgi:hypothetical protein